MAPLSDKTNLLAKVDDYDLGNLDFIGQKFPKVSPGHKSILYFVIAGGSLFAQPAWAAMSLIVVPVTVAIAAGGMGLSMLVKSADQDNTQEDDSDPDDGVVVDVNAQEVPSTPPQTPTEAIVAQVVENSDPFEYNPFKSDVFDAARGRYHGEVYDNPDEKAADTLHAVASVVDATGSELLSSESNPPMDVAKFMVVNLKPTLISAVPRSGKGIVLAQMWREFKQAYPHGIVWVIQPKPSKSELGYWEGVDNFWGEMIEEALGVPSEIKRITQELTNFVNQWRQQPQRPKILIIDEAVKIQSVLKSWYHTFLVPTIQVEASSGETDERYLYVVSQSPLVKDVGISTGNRSSLQLLHIDRPNQEENLAVLRGSFKSIPEPPGSLYASSHSPTQAIFYHTNIGQWHPMPAYPVYERTLVAAGSTATVNPFPQKSVWDKPRSPLGGTTEPVWIWEFEEEAASATPKLDAQIESFKQRAQDPRFQCVIEFLESLKGYPNGTQLNPSDFGKSTWASRWDKKEGGLKDRKAESVAIFIKNTVALGFLEPVDDKYEVKLS